MGEHRAQFVVGGPHEFRHGPVQRDGNPQRQDVRGHSGHRADGVARPGGHGQAQHHFAVTAAACAGVHVQRRRGHRQRGPAHAEPGGRVAHLLPRLAGNHHAAAHRKTVRTGRGERGSRRPREVAGIRAVRRPGKPELAVGGEVFGRAVPRLVLQQAAQRPELARGRRLPLLERGMDLSQPAREEGGAEAVQDQMMCAQVPAHAVRGELEQRPAEERAPGEVERAGQVPAHPGRRRPLRVRLLPQVHERHAPGGQRSHVLARLAPLPDGEPRPQALGFTDDVPERGLEGLRLQRPGDLDRDAHVVAGGVRRELLAQPHAGLGRGERHPAALPVLLARAARIGAHAHGVFPGTVGSPCMRGSSRRPISPSASGRPIWPCEWSTERTSGLPPSRYGSHSSEATCTSVSRAAKTRASPANRPGVWARAIVPLLRKIRQIAATRASSKVASRPVRSRAISRNRAYVRVSPSQPDGS